MGALVRATRRELLAQDVEETESALFAGVAEHGPIFVKRYAEERSWAQGPVWDWINGDAGRKARYEDAKRYKAEMGVGETLAIADGSGEAKLQVDTRFRYAEKAYPEVYGRRVAESGEVGALVDMALLGAAVELLGKVRALPTEKVVSED